LQLLSNVTAIERAFELAGSGAAENIQALKRMLDREGYDGGQIEGRALKAQLQSLITKARNESGTTDRA
jgi:hypothetical protein